MRKGTKLIRALVFLLVLALTLAGVQSVFKIGQDRAYQSVQGLYDEKETSLDAVYVGGSNVDAFWQPPLAWADHGIAVWALTVDSMPMRTVKYMITEARKTQPDALFIVNLNTFKSKNATQANLHRVVDYMKFSANKLQLIDELSDDAEITGMDKLEFVFPLVRFHAKWSELTSWDFAHSINGMKTGMSASYFYNTADVSEDYLITDRTAEMTQYQSSSLYEFLDYCSSDGVRVLFVTVPQALETEELSGQMNAIEQVVRDRGYICLDLLEAVDDMGICTETDFYNLKHTNVHGSIKFTEYLAQYLVDSYGFSDKRGQPGWESWDESVELYTDVIGPYSLPLEREHAPRDYDLDAPVLSEAKSGSGNITLSWTQSEGADSYEIYRKSAKEQDGYWHLVSAVDGDTLTFTDEGLTSKREYTYTVVPAHSDGGTVYYGNFDFYGVSAAAG